MLNMFKFLKNLCWEVDYVHMDVCCGLKNNNMLLGLYMLLTLLNDNNMFKSIKIRFVMFLNKYIYLLIQYINLINFVLTCV